MRSLPLVLATLLVAAPVLAGCVGGNDPADTVPADADDGIGIRCYGDDQLCNLDATVEPRREGNEVTIAVNPTDPGNVVAGAKDYYPESAGDCVWDGVYVTEDGGRSFASRNLPGSPWLLLNNGSKFEANDASQYWCMSDPVVAFGPDGTLYYTFLAYQGDPVTGSSIGKDATCLLNREVGVVPCSGANDVAFNRVSIGVMVSEDGGRTFSDVQIIDSGIFPVNFHDRQWVAVDQETGTVYVAWTGIYLPGNLVYRSTDYGHTWDGPVLLDETPAAIGSPGGMFVDTGPDGTVHVSGCQGGPMITTSTDHGGSFGGWQQVADAPDAGMNASYRAGQVCMVAADATQGPHRGNVYMVYSATPDDDRDVFFTRSTDGGESWSDPVRLNLDDTTNDQFFPTISVNPDGVLDVAWWDRRNDPDNRLLDVYHRSSRDGGQTFSDELRVTGVSSDPSHSKHQGGFTFIGDYIDIDASMECAWPVWVDTRHGKADVMTSCVERPGTAVPGETPGA